MERRRTQRGDIAAVSQRQVDRLELLLLCLREGAQSSLSCRSRRLFSEARGFWRFPAALLYRRNRAIAPIPSGTGAASPPSSQALQMSDLQN